MQIKELDPKKRYFVILEQDFVTREDVEAISARLKELNVDAVVLAGPTSVRNELGYWGLYCPQCGLWQREHSGALYFYPVPEIAAAHIRNDQKEVSFAIHRWEPQEFGKEEQREVRTDEPVCPVLEKDRERGFRIAM